MHIPVSIQILSAVCLAAAMLPAADPAVEKAVMAAANELSQAQMKKDKAAMERLLGDEIVYSHSSGMRETKAQHIAASMRPNSKYEKIELSEVKVQPYGNTAVLTCKALFSTNNDGKKADNHLSMMQVWNKRGNGWQLVGRWTTRVTP
jgi:ketosteroid isomerase-like protein